MLLHSCISYPPSKGLFPMKKMLSWLHDDQRTPISRSVLFLAYKDQWALPQGIQPYHGFHHFRTNYHRYEYHDFKWRQHRKISFDQFIHVSWEMINGRLSYWDKLFIVWIGKHFIHGTKIYSYFSVFWLQLLQQQKRPISYKKSILYSFLNGSNSRDFLTGYRSDFLTRLWSKFSVISGSLKCCCLGGRC